MGGGGSQPSGNTTTTVNNTPWNSAALSNIDTQAQNLEQTDPLTYYQGQTYAPLPTNNLDTLAANGNYAGTQNIGNVQPLQATAMSRDNTIAGSTLDYALNGQPWYNNLNALGSTNPAASQIGSLSSLGNTSPVAGQIGGLNSLGASNSGAPAANLLTALGLGGTGENSLAASANGAYLPGNGNSNPYLDATYQAAANPLVNTFMTSTSPRTTSQMEAAGRFNSGAANNADSINQQALAQGLGTLSAGIYEPAYENERNRQVQSAASLGGLQNTAVSNAGSLDVAGTNAQTSALGTSGQLGVGQMNAQTNALGTSGQLGVSGANSQIAATNTAMQQYNNELGTEQNAINAAPTISQLPYQDLNTAVNAQQQLQAGQQAQLTDQANAYYGNAYAPYSNLATVANIIGPAIPGTSTTTSPYFSNPTGSALGTAGGVLGLAKGIGSIAAK